MASKIEKFKEYIIQHLKEIEGSKRREEEKRKKLPASLYLNPIVFVDTERGDINIAQEIIEILVKEKIEYIMSDFDEVESIKKEQNFEEDFLDSDAVIVLYGDAPVRWVKEQLRLCQKKRIKRERPLKAIAVLNKKLSTDKPPVPVYFPPLQVIEFSTMPESTFWTSFIQDLQASITASATPVPAVSGKSTAAPAETGIAGLSQTANSLDRSVRHYDFFIAYAIPDREQAEALCWFLQDHSCEVFLDVKDISPGALWPPALRDALEASRAIVVLVSTHVDDAFYQQEEIVRAIQLTRDRPRAHTSSRSSSKSRRRVL